METIFYYFDRSKKLGRSVARLINQSTVHVGKVDVSVFNDSETKVVALDDVADKRVFILYSSTPPVNDSIMRLLVFVDGLKRGGAREIILIASYLGYSRQDRQGHPNDPITLKLVTSLLKESGVDRIYRFDPHSEYPTDYFSLPVISVTTEQLFADYFDAKLNRLGISLTNLVILSPDHGAVNRGRALQKHLPSTGFASVTKKRIGVDKIKTLFFEGDVRGKHVLIFDDIASSGETIVEAVALARNRGAKKVYVAVSHPVFSSQSSEIFYHLKLNDLVVTDSIENPLAKGTHVINIAPLVAHIINQEIN